MARDPRAARGMSSTSKAWQRHLFFALAAVAALLLAYSLVGFIILPWTVRVFGLPRVARAIHARLNAQAIHFNPFTLRLQVDQPDLRDGWDDPLFNAKQIVVNARWASLWRGGAVLDEVVLDQPYVRVQLDEHGRLNWAALGGPAATDRKDAVKKADPSPRESRSDQSKALPLVEIGRVALRGGAVQFNDYGPSEPFTYRIDGIELAADQVTTRHAVAHGSSLSLRTGQGEALSWTGTVTVDPVAVKGRLELAGLALPAYRSYLRAVLPSDITGGTVALVLEPNLSLDAASPAAHLALLDLALDNLAVTPRGQRKPVITLGQLAVAEVSADLLARTVRVKGVEVDHGRATLNREADGSIDLMRHLLSASAAKPAEPAEPIIAPEPVTPVTQAPSTDKSPEPTVIEQVLAGLGQPWTIDIAPVTVTDQQVRLRDATTTPAATLSIAVERLQAGPASSLKQWAAPVNLALRINDAATLKVDGQVQPLTPSLTLDFDLDGLRLPAFEPYWAQQTQLALTGGVLSLQGKASADLSGADLAGEATLDSLTLRSVEVRPRGEDRVILRQGLLSIEGVAADTVASTVTVQQVKLDGGSVWLRRGVDGALDILSLLGPAERPAPAASPSLPGGEAALPVTQKPAVVAPVWGIALEQVVIADQSVTVEDQTVTPAATWRVTELGARIGPVRSAEQYALPLDLALKLQDATALAVKGNVRPLPLALALQVDLRSFDLSDLQPYIRQQTAMAIPSGQLGVAGSVTLNRDAQQRLTTGFTGDVTLDNLALVPAGSDQPMVSWKSLRLSELDVAPPSVALGSLVLAEPVVQVARNEQGELNWLTAFTPAPTPVPDASAAPPDGAASQPQSDADVGSASEAQNVPARPDSLPIRVDNIEVTNGTVVLRDQTVSPAVDLTARDLNMTVRQLALAGDEAATMDLAATFGQDSSIKLSGTMQPLDYLAQTKVDLKVAGFPITSVAGFSRRFAGHDISGGRINLDLLYSLQKGQLKGDNRIHIDRVALGHRIKGSDAPDLPLRFAVALMQDANGQIRLNVPVESDMTKTQVRIMGVVLDALRDMVIKTSAAPFSMLGSVAGFGGAERDLQFVQFPANQAELNAEARAKLGAIARGLTMRPEIHLVIQGGADEQIDGLAMRRRIFWQRQAGDTPVDRVPPVTDRAYRRAIDRAHENLPPPAEGQAADKLTFEAREQAVLLQIPAGDLPLAELARQRAEVIRQYLLETGKVPAGHVALAPIGPDTPVIAGTRVEFRLEPALGEGEPQFSAP